MEMILIEGTAHEICAALHLCLWSTSTGSQPNKIVVESALPMERYFVPIPHRPATVGEKPTCTLCEFVITQLDGMLKDNSTEVKLDQKLSS